VNKRYEILTTLDLMDGATSAGCGLAELLAGVASGGKRGQSAAATSGARLGLTRPGGIAGGAPSVADGTALVVGGGCGGSSEVEAKLGATDGVTPPATGRRHLPIAIHRVCVVQLPASAVNAALPAFAAAAPCCCGAAAARGCVGQQSIDLLPAGRSAANPPHAAAAIDRWDRHTTDGHRTHRPCSAYCAGSANNSFFPGTIRDWNDWSADQVDSSSLDSFRESLAQNSSRQARCCPSVERPEVIG